MRLTVLVAGLSEWLSLGEDDGNSQILEGGDVEEGGVLVVLDVFVVVRGRYVQAEAGAGNITGTTGDERTRNFKSVFSDFFCVLLFLFFYLLTSSHYIKCLTVYNSRYNSRKLKVIFKKLEKNMFFFFFSNTITI